jgi:hypothetical protein
MAVVTTSTKQISQRFIGEQLSYPHHTYVTCPWCHRASSFDTYSVLRLQGLLLSQQKIEDKLASVVSVCSPPAKSGTALGSESQEPDGCLGSCDKWGHQKSPCNKSNAWPYCPDLAVPVRNLMLMSVHKH